MSSSSGGRKVFGVKISFLISCFVWIDHKDLQGQKHAWVAVGCTVIDIIAIRSHVAAGGEKLITAAGGWCVKWIFLLWYLSRPRWGADYLL